MPRNYKPKNAHLETEGKNKEGRFSKVELRFIQKNYESLTVDEIAKKLSRTPEMVQNKLTEILKEKQSKGEDVQIAIEYDIKKMPFFPTLKRQYSKEELMVIEYQWNYFHNQFQNDVMHTEQMQILSYCKTYIDLDRLGILEKESLEQVKRLEQSIMEDKKSLEMFGDDPIVKSRMLVTEQQIGDIRNSRRSVTDEKVKLGKQLADLTAALKGTRDQRIKVATEQQMSLTSLLKALDNEAFRKNAVRENHLLKLSAEKVRKDLGSHHKYADDLYDRPLLNSETVMDEGEET